MPKITPPSDNAITANAARTAVICRCNQAFRFSFGATYAADDSQLVRPGEPLEINGPAAKLALSFARAGGELETPVIDATLV